MKNKLTLILLLVLSVSLFATVSDSKDINLSLALDVPDSISIKVESADGTDLDLGKTVLLEYYKKTEVYSKSFLVEINTITSSNVSISFKSDGPLTYKNDYIDYTLKLYHSTPSQISDGKLKIDKDNYTSGAEYYRLETNGVITQSTVKGLFYVTIPRSDVITHFGGIYQTNLIVEMKTIE